MNSTTDIFANLKAPFPADKISWRVGATNKKKMADGKATKGIALAYIDARDVMQRLDDVIGPQNWQALHPHATAKTSCKIGVLHHGEWIWKENGAGDSDTEAEKGAFSDSFKRAAVLWGIGRYLYDVPNVWVEVNEWGQITNPDDPKLKQALKKAEESIVSGIKPIVEPSFSREDKITQIDMIDEINHCMTPNHINGFWDSYTPIIEKLPREFAATIEGQSDARSKQIDEGINPPHIYRFADVKHAEDWGKQAIGIIKTATEEGVINWHARNSHKVAALDVMLKAAKYQINGTSPAQRLRKAMNDRVMELKQGEVK